LVVGVVVCISAWPSSAKAQLRSRIVAQGLAAPVAFVPDPTSASRFFIVQQGGVIRVLENGTLSPTPLLDLTGEVLFNGEQGLLGMAFAPDAATSGRFYLNFTNNAGDIVVARFRRVPATAVTVNPATRFDLVWPGSQRFIHHPINGNHNGGNLAFGPDGYLYMGTGDGGAGNDPPNNAQNPLSLLGKMLRLDVNVPDTHPTGYQVPPNNPFVAFSTSLVRHEIWAFGLRNPWRYAFDDFGSGATGALVIGDVGQGAREEVNYEPAGSGGRNYGWRIREGSIPTPGINPNEQPAYLPLTGPVFDYVRSLGRTVAGGYVYRGSALLPAYRGRYFVADTSSSRVASVGLNVNPVTREATVTDIIDHTAELGGTDFIGTPVSFGRDRQGELYLVTFAGRILQIEGDPATLPGPPSGLSAAVLGRSVSLSWSPPATPGTTGYRLEAGSSSGGADVVNAPVGPGTSLGVGGVPDGTYYVRVRTEAGGALSPPSNEVQVVVAANCAAPPPAPSGLQFSVTNGRVTLTWGAVTGAIGYQLEAGASSGSANLAVMRTVPPLLAVDAPSGLYFVRVRALNLCGASGASNEVTVTVP
jgi:glucose/arabinose dehydrogenase